MTADRSLQALLLILLLGVVPQIAWWMANFRHPGFATVIFALNLALCGLGARTGRFRPFWIAYAAACVLSLVLFGMTSPISLLLAFTL